MPVARGNANSLVKEFMAFQTLWESQKNDPKSDTVRGDIFFEVVSGKSAPPDKKTGLRPVFLSGFAGIICCP